MITRVLPLLALLTAAQVSADLNWGACDGSSLSRFQCASHDVPLDWANPSVGKVTLAVMRYRSLVSPRLGSIFVNPGGPGGSGLQMIVDFGQTFSSYTGGQYDIISWDPRGVGKTSINVDCFDNLAEETAFWKGTIPDEGLEAKGNFTLQADIDAFYSQVDEVDALLIDLGKRCNSKSGGILPYVGTAATVRDMVELHDVVDGNGPINYWGVSYGTIIGSYFVNMFPNRVGRVILDGVVNPIYYANTPMYKLWGNSILSSENTFEGFVQSCVMAGYPACTLANVSGPQTTPADINAWVHNLIDLAYDYKKAGGTVGSADIRSGIFQQMYQPTSWPALADGLWQIYGKITKSQSSSSKSPRSIRKIRRRPLDIRASPVPTSTVSAAPTPTPDRVATSAPDPKKQPASDYALQAIKCADAVDAGNTTTRDVFDEVVLVSKEVSPLFGPMWGEGGFYCHRWGTRAVERFTGPWNHTLANPILVIGNEADPITPFASAKVVADLLGDSAILLEQDDYGHSSLAERSNCTIGIINTYFTTGVLPTIDGKLCGTNQILFPSSPVTKSSLDTSTTTTIPANSDELSKLRNTNRTLVGIDIALAAVILALVALLIFNAIRTKKARTGSGAKYDAPPTALLHKSDYHDEDTSYTTPYDAPDARR